MSNNKICFSLKIYDHRNILKSMLENELKYSNSENIERNLWRQENSLFNILFLSLLKSYMSILENKYTHTHTQILYTRIQLYTPFKVNSQTIVSPQHGIMWFGLCNYHHSYWPWCKIFFSNLSDYKKIHMKLI
jgi:hypothetical protein